MRRLLFISERYAPDAGGVAASAGRISRAIAALDTQVDVVAWTRALPAGQVDHQPGNPAVYRLGRYREWDTTMPHTLNLLDWLRTTAPYDAVWGHYATLSGFLAVWFAKLHGIPSIVSSRGNDLDRDVFPPGDFARLEWTLRNATRITTVTRELASKARALTGRDDIVYQPNAVDSEVFAPAPPDAALRASLGIADNEAVLAFAGELREKKGLTHLLEALRTVRAARPACLLLIGDVRPSEMPRLLQHVGPGTLAAHRVLVTGQLSTAAEVNRHLHLADVFLQPSLWDGMPNAMLEAMSAGCGSISSDAGGIPEMIDPGENGIMLPRWQLHRLGEAILEWLDAPPAFQSKIRANARATVLERFNFTRESQALQQLLDSLTESQTRPSDSPA